MLKSPVLGFFSFNNMNSQQNIYLAKNVQSIQDAHELLDFITELFEQELTKLEIQFDQSETNETKS